MRDPARAKWNCTGGDAGDRASHRWGAFSVSEQDVPRSHCVTAGNFNCRCSDRAAGRGRSDRAKEARGRQGRNALDVLDTLKLRLPDGGVDQSTFARLRVASEGDRNVGRCR
ncbi:MAG TPA: hypothetical protein VK200_02015 [Candidatus Limnocylindrales bacterium]|nr:hypothetical protein [Candidatus Limnocylindrales bacterium]